MKKNYLFAALGLAATLSFTAFIAPAFAEDADSSDSQNVITDQAQNMNAAPDANANAAPDANNPQSNPNPAPAPSNNGAPQNEDDAHEDAANSGDDDY